MHNGVKVIYKIMTGNMSYANLLFKKGMPLHEYDLKTCQSAINAAAEEKRNA